jgi:hypothetical protein
VYVCLSSIWSAPFEVAANQRSKPVGAGVAAATLGSARMRNKVVLFTGVAWMMRETGFSGYTGYGRRLRLCLPFGFAAASGTGGLWWLFFALSSTLMASACSSDIVTFL